MSRCLYVSFFTKDYWRPAARMIHSLMEFGLDHEVVQMPDTGRWIENCALKPKFIHKMMQDYPGRPIVWTDADSVLRQKPLAFELENTSEIGNADAAVCEYQWRRGGKETLSGTMYFAPTAGAMWLVDAWAALQAADRNVMDQRVLERAVKIAVDQGVVVRNLPVEYCFISDFHSMEWPDKKPVFEHFQYSRTSREQKP